MGESIICGRNTWILPAHPGIPYHICNYSCIQ